MTTEGPAVPEYAEIAKRTIGGWAGDRIALVGDYAEDSDLAPEHKASSIYSRCISPEDFDAYYSNDPGQQAGFTKADLFTDISDDVAKVLEHELQGSYTGTGWKNWVAS